MLDFSKLSETELQQIDLTKFTETELINYGVRANGIEKKLRKLSSYQGSMKVILVLC